jgi:hypothetical protein
MRGADQIPMSGPEELLTRAAVFSDERGIAAWHELRPRFDIERVNAQAYLLLPLLYRNLFDLGVEDELLSRLKSVYRHTWAANQTLLRSLADLLKTFEMAGIPTMLLKGAALVSSYYGDLGTRPMSDFDILVPIAARERALDLLSRLGWSAPGERVKQVVLRYFEGLEFVSPNRRSTCDLHWRVMCCLDLADDADHSADDFWLAADDTEIFGVRSQVLNPADLLLHVCVHGLSDNHVRLLWIADALHILASSGDRLDWDRLVGQTRKRGAVLALRRALMLLAGFDAPVPATVLERLARLPVGWRQAYPYGSLRRFMARNADETLLGTAAALFDLYAQASTNWSTARTILELPTFLQEVSGVNHRWEVPVQVIRKVQRRIGAARTVRA